MKTQLNKDHPHVFYGRHGTAYCEACAKKRGKLDRKPLSFKEWDRACNGCDRPIRAGGVS